MSGIVGIINSDGATIDEARLQHMLQRMKYRGPDAQNIWIDGNVGLGHALYRTCEQDIQQPYRLDHITVAAHVRIDARDDLLPLLHSAGLEAASNAPDVELLAKAYLAWGEDCLNYLFGDFAFILWDAKKQSAFGARDHYGTIPLFYSHINHTLIISTEIGSIRRHPLVSTRLNDQAIGDFLVLHNVTWVDKSQTAFADISRIPPAHRLIFKHGQLSVQRYWLPPADGAMLRYQTEDEYVEHFLNIFTQAVKDRMRSKRILLGLSGGLDSSSIAATAARLVQSGVVNSELNALTMIYKRLHPDSEGKYAGLVAQKLNIPHEQFAWDDYQIRQPLPLAAEPIVFLQNGLLEATAQKTFSLGPIGLEGHGGDEILRSNPLVETLKGLSPIAALKLLAWEWHFLGRRPAELGSVLNIHNWLKRSARANFDYPVWLNPEFERQFYLRERFRMLWEWQPPKRHFLHPRAYRNMVWADRSMGSESLHELPAPGYIPSFPFLDIRVTTFILSLPPQPWFTRKYLLRRAMRDILPDEVLSRKKTLLGSVEKSLLDQPGTEWVDQWQPVPELEKYVRRSAIPLLKGISASKTPFIDLRPLVLNEWLRHYRDV